MSPSCRPAAFAALILTVQLLRIDALWIPEDVTKDGSIWPLDEFDPLIRRDEATCGGDPSLFQCGADFPTDFCCGENTECLLLNTTSTITAALCCPAGQDCTIINPISCDQTLQNATDVPSSSLHADPPSELETCGTACCPMGYECVNNNCKALTKSETISTTPSPTSTSSTSAAVASEVAASPTAALSSEEPHISSDGFSGKSFAAGFIPGIVLGIVVIAAILFFLRRRNQISHVDEKYSRRRDTLTELGPAFGYRRPTVHGRSISEPVVDTSFAHRTDFLNHTPPEQKTGKPQEGLIGYVVNVQSPGRGFATPASQPDQHQRSWLSHSPFITQTSSPQPTQAPLPQHLKRGTLSFQISPVRALKKQRSMHSLRRQMTDVRQHRPRMSRSGSTETIKVAMDTPERNPSTRYVPHFAQIPSEPTLNTAATSQSWQTTTISSNTSSDSTPIDEEPDFTTPTRPGRNSNIQNIGATLQSPYTTPNLLRPKTPKPPSSNGTVIRHHPKIITSPTNHTSYHPHTSPSLSPLAPPPLHLAPPRIPSDRLLDHHARRETNMTTFSVMMEKAGLRKSSLYTKEQGDPRDWNRGSPAGWRGLVGKGKA